MQFYSKFIDDYLKEIHRNKLRVLVFGESGYVASKLRFFSESYFQNITFRSIRNLETTNALNNAYKYDYIVNCVGYTDTKDNSEESKKQHTKYNQVWPALLSMYCKDNKLNLCHLSTASFYKSCDSIITEDSEIDQELIDNNFYYKSKLIGERKVLSHNDNASIIRFKLPYDERKHLKNYLYRSLNYNQISKYIESISSLDSVICCILHIITKNLHGLYNMCDTHNFDLSELHPDKKKIIFDQKYNINSSKIYNTDFPYLPMDDAPSKYLNVLKTI